MSPDGRPMEAQVRDASDQPKQLNAGRGGNKKASKYVVPALRDGNRRLSNDDRRTSNSQQTRPITWSNEAHPKYQANSRQRQTNPENAEQQPELAPEPDGEMLMHPPAAQLPKDFSPPRRFIDDGSDPVRTLTVESNTSFGGPGQLYVLKEKLAEGENGSLYQCRAAVDGIESSQDLREDLSVQIINTRLDSDVLDANVILEQLRHEVGILRHLQVRAHPNIVHFVDAFFSEQTQKFYMVTELLRGRDLSSTLDSRGPLPLNEVRAIFLQITEAVTHCHSAGVAHCDLKLANIVFESDSSRKLRLCYYGKARRGDVEIATHSDSTASSAYCSPEMVKAIRNPREKYDPFKADSYALGVMLYAMLCNTFPTFGNSGKGYQNHKMWSNLPGKVRDIIENLLQADPTRRALPKTLLEHPWMGSRGQSVELDQSLSKFSWNKQAADRQSAFEILRSVFNIVSAVQSEMGLALWSINGEEGSERYNWQVNIAKSSMWEANELLRVFLLAKRHNSEICQLDGWATLGRILTEAYSTLESIFIKIQGLRDAQQPAAESDTDDIFDMYRLVIGDINRTVQDLLANIGQMSPIPFQKLSALNVLQLTADYLAKERAYVVGRLHRPESFCSRNIARILGEMIGARKVLMRDFVHLTGPLVDPSDVAALEVLEDRVLQNGRLNVPPPAEWWYHLSIVLDKVYSGNCAIVKEVVA